MLEAPHPETALATFPTADDGDVGADAPPAERVQAAVAALVRWASRGNVRAQLWRGETEALTPTDAWLLEALATSGPTRVTALATFQGVDKSTVTPQVRRLERAGLVQRTKDPADGRAVLLSLSERGKRVLDGVRSSGTDLVGSLMASWSASDRSRFAELFTRFVAGLDAATPDGKPDRQD